MMLDNIIIFLKTEFHCKSGLELLFIPIGCYMFFLAMIYNKKRFEAKFKKEVIPFEVLIKESKKETDVNWIKILLLYPIFALILMIIFNRIDSFTIMLIFFIGYILFDFIRKNNKK